MTHDERKQTVAKRRLDHPLASILQGLSKQRTVVATESVHKESEKFVGKKTVGEGSTCHAESGHEPVTELGGALHKAKLSAFTVIAPLGVRHRATAYAVGERGLRQIGNAAVEGAEKHNLQVLATQLSAMEKLRILPVGTTYGVGAVESRAEVYHGRCLLGDDGFQHSVTVGDGLWKGHEGIGRGESGVGVEPLPAGVYERHFRVCQHHFIFPLQFGVVCPPIVTRTICQILPASCHQTIEIVVHHSFVGSLWHQAHHVGVLFGISFAHPTCAIGGAIFSYHDFKAYTTTLTQDGIERATDGVLLIEGHHDDGNDGLVVHLVAAMVAKSTRRPILEADMRAKR